MKILLSPNSFKGTCTANEMALHLSGSFCQFQSGLGLKAVNTINLPIADGGDDTLEVLQAQHSGDWQVMNHEAIGPLDGFTVDAPVLYSPKSQMMVVEAAKAHGISILTKLELSLNAMEATSYGVGQLIQKALASQAEEILVTLGGSASTDGGLGALQALGIVFLGSNGNPVVEIVSPKHFSEIQAVCPFSIQTVRDYLKGKSLCILTDVKNPLLGETGTAFTFAPQKGASPQDCEYLEIELSRLANLVDEAFGTDCRNVPGAGAAGGLGYGLLQLPNARIQSGFEWLSTYLGLEEAVLRADVVVTGEGRFDGTSAQGKATGELVTLAKRHQKKVILLCGSIQAQALQQADYSNLFSISLTDVVPLQEAIERPGIAVQKAFKHYETGLKTFLAQPVVGLGN